ncbi:M15 family metallopeptidase [Anaerolentibacter hominis]|uniref:M15 family metallopeptidase n=1 Tax=Anaerolentibacter hominis TaxID=3079009 RepID=UPI0031B80609
MYKKGKTSIAKQFRREHPHLNIIIHLLLMIMVLITCTFIIGNRLLQNQNGFPQKSSASEVTVKEKKDAVQLGQLSNSEDDWKLLLVNPWNYVPEDLSITLTQLRNGQAVDERCYPDLQDMMDDCRAAGLNPLICSSYRSIEKQERLYQNKVNKLISQGYSRKKAETEAAKSVALPGTSEHQLGLAVDIVDKSYQHLDTRQEKTEVQKWLMKNSWKYGFILRYPNNKSDITGIIYEPWHYRYVGKEAAQEIYEQDICLEEYLEQMAEDI